MTNASDNSQDKPTADGAAPSTQEDQSTQNGPSSALPAYMQQTTPDTGKEQTSTADTAEASADTYGERQRASSRPLSPFEMAVKHTDAAEEQPPAREAPRPYAGIGAAVADAQQSAAFAVEPDGTAHTPAASTTNSATQASQETPLEQSPSSAAPAPDWDYGTQPAAAQETVGKDLFAAKAGTPPSPGFDTAKDGPASGSSDKEVRPEPKPEKKKSGFGFSGKTTARKPAAPKGPKPVYPPFDQTHPLLSVEQSMPASVGSRIFNAFAVFPVLPLTLFFLLQTIFTLDARELWFSDEIRHAAALQNLLYHGKGLILELNGQVYPDKPPLYFWFLRGLYQLLQTDGPMLHLTAAALSGLLYLWSALALGSFAARVDKRTNFAAGLILLSCGYIMGTFHYGRMDLLFSVLIIGSHILLYRAFVRPENAFPGMIAGFALAGLATLVKGPLGLAFPVCSLVFFAVWRGTVAQRRCVLVSLFALICGLLPPLIGLDVLQLFGLLHGAESLPWMWGALALVVPALALLVLALLQPQLRLCLLLSALVMVAAFVLAGGTPYFRWPLAYALPALLAALLAVWQATPQRFFRLDFYAGLVAGVAVACSWFAAIYLVTGDVSFILNDVLKVQVLERAADTFHHKASWHYYLLRLPLMFLPWVLLVFFLPWNGVASGALRRKIAESRLPENEGIAFLWSMVISAVILLSALSGKILIYFLPIAPAVCLLMARGVLGLSGRRAVLFRYAMAIFLALAGVLLAIAALMLFDILPMPDIKGVPHWVLPSSIAFFAAPVLLLIAGAALWLAFGSSRPEGVLLVTALFATIAAIPLAGYVAPAFDGVLSPKNQALLMRAYIEKGYAAASYKDYPGTYTFYSGNNIPRLASLQDATAAAEKGNFVLAIRKTHLDEWQDKPSCLEAVHTQWIETREFVLLACPPIANLAPADVPYKPAPDIIGEGLRLLGLESFMPKKADAPAPAAPDQGAAGTEKEPGKEADAPASDAAQPADTPPDETPDTGNDGDSASAAPSAPVENEAATAPDADAPAADAPAAAQETAPEEAPTHDAAPQEQTPEPADGEVPGQTAPEEDAAHSQEAGTDTPVVPADEEKNEASASDTKEEQTQPDAETPSATDTPADAAPAPENQDGESAADKNAAEENESPAGEREDAPAPE